MIMAIIVLLVGSASVPWLPGGQRDGARQLQYLAPISAAHQRVWISATGARTNDPGQTIVEHPLNAGLGAGLMPAGYDGAPQEVPADSSWPVWKIAGPVPADTALEFQWLDEFGRRVSDIVMPLAAGDYPVTDWQSGEILRQHYAVLPPRGTSVTN